MLKVDAKNVKTINRNVFGTNLEHAILCFDPYRLVAISFRCEQIIPKLMLFINFAIIFILKREKLAIENIRTRRLTPSSFK